MDRPEVKHRVAISYIVAMVCLIAIVVVSQLLMSNRAKPADDPADGTSDTADVPNAVSYTHLDVYKRQVPESFYGNLRSRRVCGRDHKLPCFIKPACLSNAPVFAGAFLIETIVWIMPEREYLMINSAFILGKLLSLSIDIITPK